METIWPRSNSPCSGVLKFKLASNASAKLASAFSLDWVIGCRNLSDDCSQVRENGWAAYLTRKSDTPAQVKRRSPPACSASNFFQPILRAEKGEPTLMFPAAPDAPRL